jgi:hypothetical protein
VEGVAPTRRSYGSREIRAPAPLATVGSGASACLLDAEGVPDSPASCARSWLDMNHPRILCAGTQSLLAAGPGPVPRGPLSWLPARARLDGRRCRGRQKRPPGITLHLCFRCAEALVRIPSTGPPVRVSGPPPKMPNALAQHERPHLEPTGLRQSNVARGGEPGASNRGKHQTLIRSGPSVLAGGS